MESRNRHTSSGYRSSKNSSSMRISTRIVMLNLRCSSVGDKDVNLSRSELIDDVEVADGRVYGLT